MTTFSFVICDCPSGSVHVLKAKSAPSAAIPIGLICRPFLFGVKLGLLPQLDLYLIAGNLAIVNRQAGACWPLDYSAILKRESRGMPRTLDCAFGDLALVERRTIMRAHGAQCINCAAQF